MTTATKLLKDKRIFIIEDNPKNFALTQTILEMAGATVWFDRFGDKTFTRLQEFHPVDLILLDLMFPNNVTGYDLFQGIRTMPNFMNVPIVAVSASDPSTAIPKTQEMGFSGFIPKPISYENFVKQVAQVVIHQDEIWLYSS